MAVTLNPNNEILENNVNITANHVSNDITYSPATKGLNIITNNAFAETDGAQAVWSLGSVLFEPSKTSSKSS